MTTIKLTTFIKAPAERCFDLSLSVDLHMKSTQSTGEKIVGGRASGVMQLDETVTWEAVHFGVKQQLTTRITQLTRPVHFRDEMVKGAFKRFQHDHYFEAKDGGTVMRDIFCYETPFGIFGSLFDILALKRHMTKFLEEKNRTIKAIAEGNEWVNFLK
jgi:ligand-binding SRPBCC domain-containing protein